MTDEEAEGLKTAFSMITPQWLAGFFDGEGCVSTRLDGGHYYIKVSVSQKDDLFIKLLLSKFPGGGHYVNNSGVSDAIWTGKSALSILWFVKDHVILKRSQVLAALEILSLTLSYAGATRVHPDDEKRRSELGKKIREAKGKSDFLDYVSKNIQ